ncbi:drug/metabolite transporter (DMT)-like permease [Actinoalloteichus hoggarensis]|uniref:Putative inner membrane transporter yiJE n=1 Tax=Actinoalloteichus hoggarensis TaxID=1470176 RepID=A0A221W701_9PSEU|nr:DMT family transporter [Actinoalloteichus hoggarensis]ASO21349.1 putative inner membrane transporter yiJE [Actinoalloteichus hoggarensis]MBB5921282.1 drug/metabolite transporter (DMT)-like permease [Actinoalloteichus hoggarensis]
MPATTPPLSPAGSAGHGPAGPGLALGAAAVTVVAWASAFVAIRRVGETFSPGPLALGRLLVGAGALGLLLLLRNRSWVRPTRREWALLTLCGLTWFAIYNLALNTAERSLDAGTTSMLVNIGPVLIALGAGVLLGEGFPRWLLIGAAVSMGGVVIIGMGSTGDGAVDGGGVLLCVVAAITYAIGALAQKPVLHRLPALQVTWLACAIGAVACLPFAPGLVGEVGRATPAEIGGLLYLGLVPTALAFSTWAYALARMSAGRLGVTTYLVPPLTILGGVLLLDEVPPPPALFGGVLCLLGVALSRRREHRPRPSTPGAVATPPPAGSGADAPPAESHRSVTPTRRAPHGSTSGPDRPSEQTSSPELSPRNPLP